MATLPETAFPLHVAFPDCSDWDTEPDWDAAWDRDRPLPEDEEWWKNEIVAREYKGMRYLDGPTDADIEEAHRISAWQDAIDWGRMISDEDIITVLGCAG
jgi:hypothetical protein